MNEMLSKLYKGEAMQLYPGIELLYLEFTADSFSMESAQLDDIMEINYCKAGSIIWKMGNGNLICLNPGDLFIQEKKVFCESELLFPTGKYEGLTILVDLKKTASEPPELLKDTEIFESVMSEQFCRNGAPTFLAGNEVTEGIFSAFYGQPEKLREAYQRVKVLELFLYLSGIELTEKNQLTEYKSEQMETVRKVHDELIEHMERRVTIDEISKKYLINATTLKTVFKDIYGTSIAAHVKEHRMEQAAKLLRETNKSLLEIAQAVGYDSQSKFTAAFKNFYKVLPKEYRKKAL